MGARARCCRTAALGDRRQRSRDGALRGVRLRIYRRHAAAPIAAWLARTTHAANQTLTPPAASALVRLVRELGVVARFASRADRMRARSARLRRDLETVQTAAGCGACSIGHPSRVARRRPLTVAFLWCAMFAQRSFGDAKSRGCWPAQICVGRNSR